LIFLPIHFNSIETHVLFSGQLSQKGGLSFLFAACEQERQLSEED
jgi:hypothetical protein